MTSRSNASELTAPQTTEATDEPARKKGARQPPTAREAALRHVSRRLLSERELQQRLSRRGFDEAAVDDAIAMVKEYGYLDDRQLASAVVREAERTGRGPRWVHATLRRRGVEAELARSAEAESLPGVAERAREAAIKRFGEPSELDQRARERALRYLLGRGFPTDAALNAMDAD